MQPLQPSNLSPLPLPLDEALRARLDVMLHQTPKAWGSPDGFENQVLLILEILTNTLQNPQWVLKQYMAYLRSVDPSRAWNFTVSSVYPDHDVVAERLRGFRQVLRDAGHPV